jgi:hypothetical protein
VIDRRFQVIFLFHNLLGEYAIPWSIKP